MSPIFLAFPCSPPSFRHVLWHVSGVDWCGLDGRVRNSKPSMPASQQRSTALVLLSVPVFLGMALLGYQVGAIAWRRRKEQEKADGGSLGTTVFIPRMVLGSFGLSGREYASNNTK